MDYKEKVIALLNSQELSKEQKEKLENIFPELKKSKDDRIVRCLLNYFNHVRYNGLDLKGTDIDEVIAWLEKQGKEVTNINGEDYGIDGLYHAIKILERTVGRVTGYQSDDGILSHEAAINAVKELYEKQGEKKTTDKSTPKFKIQDAKDGDVLVNGSNIFIFHFLNDTRLMGYCHVNTDDGRFYDDLGKNECFCLIDAIVTPATKIQRDQLFQQMKEAGYEWDANKKELKKIEVKTLNADKVIEWLKNTIKETEERFGYNDIYKETRLTLPYDSIEDFINDFKEKFGLC